MKRLPAPIGHSRGRLSAIVIAAVIGAAAIAGCGGADPGSPHVEIGVSTDFGSHTVGTAVDKRVNGSVTDLALLKRHFTVTTSHRGAVVESINGAHSHNFHVKWELYINGILDGKLARATATHKGDHQWWDLQNWLIAQPKAIVGAYPEPFTNGSGGREAPTVLECAGQQQQACNLIGADLRKAGVKAGIQDLGGENGDDSNGVIVGTWSELKDLIAVELVNAGPRKSGVFAQYIDGHGLELYNPIGGVARTLHGSTGMIAALQNGTQIAPAWIVTGNDQAAVLAAARHFNAASLHNHFAVAIQNNAVIPVPVVGP
jgi:hypothetical protein